MYHPLFFNQHTFFCEQNAEWEKFQSDLLTSVRVANDFKTEAQLQLQRMILENKSFRDRERQLQAEIEKLKGKCLDDIFFLYISFCLLSSKLLYVAKCFVILCFRLVNSIICWWKFGMTKSKFCKHFVSHIRAWSMIILYSIKY